MDPGFTWAVVRASDLPGSQAGSPPDFLSPSEVNALRGLRFEPRRRKWLLGRMAAKRVLLPAARAAFGATIAASDLSVTNDPSGAPLASLAPHGRLPWALSISHRRDFGLAALGTLPVVALGVDLETLEPRTPGWYEDYFTRRELDEVRTAAHPELAAARIWSGKESMLKALGVGLRRDTRDIEVLGGGDEAPADQWRTLGVTVLAGDSFEGEARAYWQRTNAYVLTAVAIRRAPGGQ